MALTERLALLITLDADGAVRGLEKVGRTAERNLGKAENKIDRVAHRMQKAGAGMLAGAGLAATGLYRAGQAASDLEQAVGGTEAVFKETSGVIESFAKNAARDMGLSEREFREATTAIGGQLKRMTGDVDLAAEQSVELTRVAADLAATYGGTTAEAVQALGAAFRGEADPAERFNLNLKASAVSAKAVELGLAASTSAVDDNARAQALLALITEQSADAQGQFAREAGTAAGQMQIANAEFENAKAALGEAVAPIIADVAGSLSGLAGGFSDLNNATGGVLSKLATFGTLGLGAAGAVSTVAGKVIELNASLRDAEGNLTRSGRAMRVVAKAGIGLAALALGAEFHRWADGLSALNVEASELEGLGVDALADQLKEIFQSAIGRSAGTAARSLELVTEKMTDLSSESPAVVEQFIALAETADGDLKRAMEQAGVSVDDLRAAYDAGIGSTVRATKAQERSAAIVDEAAGASEDLADATGMVADEAEDAEKAVSDLVKSVSDLFDEITSALEAEIEFEEALDDLSDTLAENGRTLDINTEAGRDNARALLDAKNAVVGIIEQRLRETGSLGEATRAGEAYVAQLKNQLREAGFTEDQIAELVRQYGLVPNEVATRIKAEGVQETIAGIATIETMLRGLNGQQSTVTITTRRTNEDGTVTVGSNIARRDGGPIPGPTGAPVPFLGHGGEFVLSADVVDAIKRGSTTRGLPMSGASGSGTYNITINNPVGEPTEASIKAELRRAQLMAM